MRNSGMSPIAISSEFPGRISSFITYDGASGSPALKAGAQAYLLKSLVSEDLLTRSVLFMPGKSVFRGALATCRHVADDTLTAREMRSPD